MDSSQKEKRLRYVYPKALVRYYLQKQFAPSKPKKLVLLIEAIVTVQLVTLAIPLTGDEGFPWDYDTFWPLWYALNAVARQDRILAEAGVQQLTIIYAAIVVLAGRLLLLSILVVYLGRLGTREFKEVLQKGFAHTLIRYVSKVDRVVQLAFDRVLSIPLVSITSSALVCRTTCVPQLSLTLCALALPLLTALIVLDRVNTCDLLWTPHSDCLYKSHGQVVVAAAEMFAAVVVPMCSMSDHNFLLRLVIAVCGAVKAMYIYTYLPFHSSLLNTIESFQGVMLVWEVVLLTVTMNYDSTGLSASLCLAAVSPFLFLVNRTCVSFLEKRAQAAPHVSSETVYAHVLRTAMAPRDHRKWSEEVLLPDDPRLREWWIDKMDFYPLVWTGYLFYIQNNAYFMKLVISQLASANVDWITALAHETCVTRLQMRLLENPDDAALQHFLRLNQTQEKLRWLDCDGCVRLKAFYLTLRSSEIKYNIVYSQVHMLHQELTKVLRMYRKACNIFQKKVSLLTAYHGLLSILGYNEKVWTRQAAKVQKKILQVSESSKKDRSFGVSRLLNEDTECSVFVVPFAGPQKGTILWTVNASKLGYADEDVRGMDFNIIIPERFKSKHEVMMSRLLSKRSVPNILQATYKMYIVNIQKELQFGLWHVFATNLPPHGYITMVATVRFELPPKEFAILSDDNLFMEKTPLFAEFVRVHPGIELKLDFTNPELLWTGNVEGQKVLLSQEPWEIMPSYSLRIVTLNKIRGRMLSRKQSNICFTPRPDKKAQDGNIPSSKLESALFSRITRRPPDSGSVYGTVSPDQFVIMEMGRLLRRYRVASYLFVFKLLLITALSAVISVVLLMLMHQSVDYMNKGISEMNTIGIRRFLGVNSALRSKELFMINSGLTVIGNETKSRAELATVGNLMKQMTMSVLGNASEASGYYKRLVMEPIMPWWRYEDREFSLRHVTLINLMSEISDHAKSLVESPLSNITMLNPHFMMLYRNGASETLSSFNHTIDAYSADMLQQESKARDLIALIMVTAIIAELLIGAVISLPLIIVMARTRRRTWQVILHLPKRMMLEAIAKVTDRLMTFHELDDSQHNESSGMPLKIAGVRSGKYYMSGLQIAFIGVSFAFLFFASLYILHIYTVGMTQSQVVLQHKPLIINWSGLRRAITQFTVFNMREQWLLNSNFSYLTMIPEDQYRFRPLVHMQRGFNELEYLHHSLIYGNTKANTSALPPSNAHKDLLFGNPCNGTCDPLLRKGVAPLVNEVLMAFRDTWSALNRGETDYAKNGGKKTEKAVGALMPYLSTLVQQYDSDTLDLLKTLQAEASDLCGVYAAATCSFFLFLMLPLVVLVTRMQNYKRFQKEVTVFQYLPKEPLYEALSSGP